MGTLFGYCGVPLPGLMAAMARQMAHRITNGWEQVRLSARDGTETRLAHGCTARHATPQLWSSARQPEGFAYAGALFSSLDMAAPELPLAQLSGDPQAALERLDGAFVAALGRGVELLLVRDPAGIKTVYWTRHKERLLFASEIKALLVDPAVERRLRPGALTEYLTFSFVPGQGTMIEGVQELQPGHILTFRNGSVACRRHFRFEDLEGSGLSLTGKQSAARLRGTLEHSVAQCCAVSDTPPAVFVSGGIDSSAVLALTARRFKDRTIDTYSIHFGPHHENENPFVSQVVERYRTRHTWLEITPRRFLDRMRHIVWCLDDPIGDPITVPNFLMAQAASARHRVVLNGEGGDPCFGGPKNIPMMLARLYGRLPDETGDSWLPRNYLRSYRKCFTDLDRILSPDAWRASGGETALCDIIAPLLQADRPRSYLNRLMSINIRLKGANLILIKVEKMTTANGVLAMPPLFTKAVVAASMALPPHHKLAGNVEKWVLKRAVADILPADIVNRPKSGMMVPVRHWFQKEMRRFAKKTLHPRRLKATGLFNPEYIRNLLRYDGETVRGARCGLKLWMLCTFMLWYDQVIVCPPVDTAIRPTAAGPALPAQRNAA